jgi:hypothetical protein
MDDVIIFQKLTSQELVILSALDHLKDDLATNLEEDEDANEMGEVNLEEDANLEDDDLEDDE